MENSERTVVVIGGSTGIGLELMKYYLSLGFKVLLIGRSQPLLDNKYSNLLFFKVDFEYGAENRTSDLIDLIRGKGIYLIDYFFLNSGVFCDRMRKMSTTPLEEMNKMMNVNVFSHKWVLDTFIESNVEIKHCVASSSIAGVRAREGNGGYAITKSAFNMLLKIYALEHKKFFFSVLGLCVVDTYLGQKIANMPMDVKFEEQIKLRERARDSKYWTSAKSRVEQIAILLEKGPEKYLNSGDFKEIREVLKDGSFEFC